MSRCTIESLTIEGWAALRLENALVRCDLLPLLGGKVWNLWHKPRDVQWIWHRPLVGLQAAQPSSEYDDLWAGGWEELFPNDAPGSFEGRRLPDHGEWWTASWEAEVVTASSGAVEVRLTAQGSATPTRWEKRFRLERGASAVRVHYQITNLGAAPLRFLFKQHLAVAVTPDHEIDLPGGTVTPVDPGFSTRLGAAGPFQWPHGVDAQGRRVDLRLLPPAHEGHREFLYLRHLPEGWCGVRDRRTGASIRLHFDLGEFPYTWLFMTFGGWKDLYTVVLEPCTNMPKDLASASALGQCAQLEGHQTVQYDVRVELS